MPTIKDIMKKSINKSETPQDQRGEVAKKLVGQSQADSIEDKIMNDIKNTGRFRRQALVESEGFEARYSLMSVWVQNDIKKIIKSKLTQRGEKTYFINLAIAERLKKMGLLEEDEK